jgi:hypothetical protein
MPIVQAHISAAGNLIPGGLGAIQMCDRIHLISNQQMTNFQMYKINSRIQMNKLLWDLISPNQNLPMFKAATRHFLTAAPKPWKQSLPKANTRHS